MDNRQTLIILCLTSLVGNIGFSLLFPILPYYTQAIPSAYALAAHLTPPDIRRLIMGMTSSFFHGGLALTLQLRALWPLSSSYGTIFHACSLGLILGIIVVVTLTGKRRQSWT